MLAFVVVQLNCTVSTLPDTNIAPENRPSQKESHLPTIHFQKQTVSFREGKSIVIEQWHGNPSRPTTAIQNVRFVCSLFSFFLWINSICFQSVSWLHLSTPVFGGGCLVLECHLPDALLWCSHSANVDFHHVLGHWFLGPPVMGGWNGEKRGETRRWWRTTSFVSWPDSNFSEAFGKGKDPKVRPHHSWFWLVKLTWTSRIHIL